MEFSGFFFSRQTTKHHSTTILWLSLPFSIPKIKGFVPFRWYFNDQKVKQALAYFFISNAWVFSHLNAQKNTKRGKLKTKLYLRQMKNYASNENGSMSNNLHFRNDSKKFHIIIWYNMMYLEV